MSLLKNRRDVAALARTHRWQAEAGDEYTKGSARVIVTFDARGEVAAFRVMGDQVPGGVYTGRTPGGLRRVLEGTAHFPVGKRRKPKHQPAFRRSDDPSYDTARHRPRQSPNPAIYIDDPKTNVSGLPPRKFRKLKRK